MEKDIRSDIIVACVVIVISVAVVVSTAGYPKVDGEIGARTFPVILSCLLAALSLVLLARTVWRVCQRRDAKPESRGLDPMTLRRIAVTVIAIAIYVAIVKWLGFILTSALFLGSLSVYYGERRILVGIGFSLIGVLVIYVLFGVLARVPFPDGLVESLLPRRW